MSLLSAINNATSGMQAIQSSMQVISGNISNAQNPDYTKKTINLSADQVSGGVVVSGYSRTTDNSLNSLVQQSLGDNGLRGTQDQYLTAIQNLLGSSQGTPVLTQAMSDFAASWRALAAQPESTTQQQDVVFKAQNLVREVNRLSIGLAQVQTNIQSDMQSSVNTLNATLSTIKDLNEQILGAQSNGQQQALNNLLDQRDMQVRTLSTLVNIQVFPRAGNAISIYTPGGVSLLDGMANQFSWNGAVLTLDPGSTDMTHQLNGGKIEALAGLLDQGSSAAALADPGKASVYKIQQQLTSLVDLFTSSSGTFATAYNGATTGAGELASGFFTGTTPSSFAVATNLANGTMTVKQAAAGAVSDDMDVNTRTITAPGLTVTNTDYTGYTDAIISQQNQNLQVISQQADLYKAQAQDYTQKLQSATGVNIDDELAILTQLQNNYAASAHVLSVIQQMFQAIEQI